MSLTWNTKSLKLKKDLTLSKECYFSIYEMSLHSPLGTSAFVILFSNLQNCQGHFN